MAKRIFTISMRFTKKIDLINILNILKKSNFKSFWLH